MVPPGPLRCGTARPSAQARAAAAGIPAGRVTRMTRVLEPCGVTYPRIVRGATAIPTPGRRTEYVSNGRWGAIR